MTGKSFEPNETTLPVIEELGRHMPGGFFIYRAEAPEELLYANKACFDIFGCNGPEDFKALTGYTFKGLVYPEDYEAISSSISEQIDKNEDNMGYAEYRIRRKDGQLRWVDDCGHYTVTEQYGGVYYVFISDITEKRAKTEKDLETRSAVISTLTNAYNTVWLINDVETETCSLFHTDMDAIHAEAIRNALSHAKYTDTKTQYVAMMVAAEDQERMQEQISLPYILKQFEKRDSFSINFIRTLESGPKHYRIDFGKVYMPGGRIGVTMGFKDVDTEIREGRAVQKALLEAKKTEEENRRLAQEVESFAKMGEFMASISSLLTNMPAMSFSKDAESRVYLACNQAFAEYAGKAKPEEVVGHTDHELFDKVTADHFVEDDSKALAMDEAYIFFEDVPDATGQQFRNLQTTKTKFHDPSGRLCLMGLCVDVTEVTRLKTAEVAAVAKQQELEEKLTLQEQLLEQEKRRKEQDAMITAMASDYRSVYHVDLDADDAVCYRADPGDPAQTPEGIHFPFHARFREYGELYVDEEYLEDYYDFVDPDNITKSLVELMNGHVEVESEKGVGTTFTVTVTLGESDRKDGSVGESDLQPHEMSVLVIDDDPIALEHAQIILGQVGVHCETASSGTEGLEMVRVRHARRDNYDLVLVDWRMPEMDGVEATRQIRSIVGHEMPIIILTSFNWDEIADEAKAAGIDAFVPKPLFAGSVLDEFREAFKRKNEALVVNRADLTGRHVLLAEDMPVNAEIMVMVLSMREIEADLAENGRIAVEMFAKSPEGYYDAILMDMRMPEMDGLEATRTIRAMGRADAKTIPIIALTANAFDEDVQRSMQAGLDAHLSKPVEPEALFDTLESLIQA